LSHAHLLRPDSQADNAFQLSEVTSLDHSISLVDDEEFDPLDLAGERIVLKVEGLSTFHAA
jgi:hypothetical protein